MYQGLTFQPFKRKTGDTFVLQLCDLVCDARQLVLQLCDLVRDTRQLVLQLYEKEKLDNEKLKKDVEKLRQELSDISYDLEKAKNKHESRSNDSRVSAHSHTRPTPPRTIPGSVRPHCPTQACPDSSARTQLAVLFCVLHSDCRVIVAHQTAARPL